MIQPSRICNLILFIFLSACSQFSFYGFSLVATQMQDVSCDQPQLYCVSPSLNYWYASAFLLGPVIFTVPSSLVISSCSVKIGLAVGVGFCILGAWLRVGINSSFTLTMIGQYLMGISYPFYRNAITQISAHWFLPENVSESQYKRALSTTLFVMANIICTTLSLFLPYLAIDVDTIPPGKAAYYRTRVTYYFIIYAATITSVSILAFTFYRNAPSVPVSVSSEGIRVKPKDSFKFFFQNYSSVLLALSLGLSCAVNVSYSIVMQSGFEQYGAQTSSLSLYVLISLPILVVISLPVSVLAGKIGKYKIILIILTSLALLSIVLVIIFLQLKSATLLGTCFLVINVAITMILALGYEAVSQICYPVSQSFAAGIILFSFKLFSFLLVQASSLLLSHDLVFQTLCLFAFVQLVALALILPVKCEQLLDLRTTSSTK